MYNCGWDDVYEKRQALIGWHIRRNSKMNSKVPHIFQEYTYHELMELLIGGLQCTKTMEWKHSFLSSTQ
jgi:hypothetical protein